MSKDTLVVGDSVFNSPVGTGTVTGITQAGYPQVNDIAVGRMVHKTEDGQFLMFDPNNTYKGDWEMFIDNERYPSESISKSVVIVRSSQEAIAFCLAVKSLPKNIIFGNSLNLEDFSFSKFINWLEDILINYPSSWSLKQNFEFSVSCRDSLDAQLIEYIMRNAINKIRCSLIAGG